MVIPLPFVGISTTPLPLVINSFTAVVDPVATTLKPRRLVNSPARRRRWRMFVDNVEKAVPAEITSLDGILIKTRNLASDSITAVATATEIDS